MLSGWASADIAGGGPREVILEKIDQAMVILNDSGLQQSNAVPELRRRLVEVLEPLFIFREMSVRALGTHARALQAEQIDRFSAMFKKLLERVYIDRLTAHLVSRENPYRVQDIQITGQELKGNYARIYSKARISKGSEETELIMNYRLVRRDGRWAVYDIEIEGVSLIENYRSQFNEVLTNHPFEYLLESVEKNVKALEEEAAVESKPRTKSKSRSSKRESAETAASKKAK